MLTRNSFSLIFSIFSRKKISSSFHREHDRDSTSSIFSREKVRRGGGRCSLQRFVKLFATTTTAALLPEGCQFVTRERPQVQFTLRRRRRLKSRKNRRLRRITVIVIRVNMCSLSSYASRETRSLTTFSYPREEDGVHAEVFDSENGGLNGRKESFFPFLAMKNVNFLFTRIFSPPPRRRRRREGEEYIFNYAFNHGEVRRPPLRAVNIPFIIPYYPLLFFPCLRYDRSN